MKLYTEQQVTYMIKSTMFPLMENRDGIAEMMLDKLTPIELPSDEEIEKLSNILTDKNMKECFLMGAKWMKDKIQMNNK